MRVKICGITSAADARLAEESGADAIGLIMAEGSKRQLDVSAAAAIAGSVGPLLSVIGVFRDQPFQFVIETAARLRLAAVQLHGSEDREFVRAVREKVRVIRAVAYRPGLSASELASWPADAVLLDAVSPGAGVPFDWQAAAELAGWPGLILAGGLNPANVAEAVAVLRPAAVDVASGVEATAGLKSPELVRSFVSAARTAGRVSTGGSVS